MEKPKIVIPIKLGVDLIIETVRLNYHEEFLVYFTSDGSKKVGTYYKSLSAALKYAADQTIY